MIVIERMLGGSRVRPVLSCGYRSPYSARSFDRPSAGTRSPMAPRRGRRARCYPMLTGLGTDQRTRHEPFVALISDDIAEWKGRCDTVMRKRQHRPGGRRDDLGSAATWKRAFADGSADRLRGRGPDGCVDAVGDVGTGDDEDGDVFRGDLGVCDGGSVGMGSHGPRPRRSATAAARVVVARACVDDRPVRVGGRDGIGYWCEGESGFLEACGDAATESGHSSSVGDLHGSGVDVFDCCGFVWVTAESRAGSCRQPRSRWQVSAAMLSTRTLGWGNSSSSRPGLVA